MSETPPVSNRKRLVNAVSKSTLSNATDLSGVTKTLSFHNRYAGDIELNELSDEVSQLSTALNANDDLQKFKVLKAGVDDATARAAAARKFVKKTASEAWLPTLLAGEGRANPGLIMVGMSCWAVAVTCFEKLYLTEERFGSADCDDGTCKKYSIKAPYTSVAVVGGALFFLMVFRTNASYDHWWEGRKKWGMIINRTRDFVRQSCAFVSDPQLNDSMTRWTVAFAITTKRHLRFERGLTELEGMFPAAELAKISGAKHMPLYCLERLSTLTRIARLDPREHLVTDIIHSTMDANLTQFEDELGACERILKTPFPFAYVVHLRTFMCLWLMALPFALVGTTNWLTIPVTLIVAYALLGIETIAVEIENPFGHDFNDLPIDSICQTIEGNLFELLQRRIAERAQAAAAAAALRDKALSEWASLSSTAAPNGAAGEKETTYDGPAKAFCEALTRAISDTATVGANDGAEPVVPRVREVTVHLLLLAMRAASARTDVNLSSFQVMPGRATVRLSSADEFAELAAVVKESVLW